MATAFGSSNEGEKRYIKNSDMVNFLKNSNFKNQEENRTTITF
jgi:hypothetical protein